MNNVVTRDVTPCGFCKNRRFGGTYRLLYQGYKNQRTRSTFAFLILMMEAIGSSETSVITRATRRHIP
jgi:hypothetical protein